MHENSLLETQYDHLQSHPSCNYHFTHHARICLTFLFMLDFYNQTRNPRTTRAWFTNCSLSTSRVKRPGLRDTQRVAAFQRSVWRDHIPILVFELNCMLMLWQGTVVSHQFFSPPYYVQLLHDVSLVVSTCRLLGEELRMLKMWGGLRLNIVDICCEDTR